MPVLLVAVVAAPSGGPATFTGVVRNGLLETNRELVGPDEVRVVRPGVGPMTPPPLHLQKGDELTTGRSTEVLLRFVRSYALVRPNTRVAISSLFLHGPGPLTDDEAPPARADTPADDDQSGSVLVNTRGKFRLHADLAEALVEGTRYAFRVDAVADSRLRVFAGSVRLRSTTGAWPDVRVGAGEQAEVRGTAPPVKRALIGEERATLDTAFEAFDRLIDLGGGAF